MRRTLRLLEVVINEHVMTFPPKKQKADLASVLFLRQSLYNKEHHCFSRIFWIYCHMILLSSRITNPYHIYCAYIKVNTMRL